MQPQAPFRVGGGGDDRSGGQVAVFGFGEDGGHPHRRHLQVGPGFAFQRGEPFRLEHVVGGPVVDQVPEFEGRQSHLPGDAVPLRVRVVGGQVTLVQSPAGLGGHQPDQVLQGQHLPGPGFIGFAVFAVHRPERDVLHPGLGGDPGAAGGPEHLGEMVGLPGVHHVQDQIGRQLLHPHPDGGQVGGGVQVGPARGADDQRRDFGFVIVLGYFHDHRPLRLPGGPGGEGVFHQGGEAVPHGAFPMP